MDEIVIGEKKYISSKQAAKLTGYAKDYVGQLCREGRVPARLVGRGWYVLETAIQDHRFGDPKDESGQEQTARTTESVLSTTWESPRYEASKVELLPSVNRLRNEDQKNEPVEDKDNGPEADQQLQDTWQAWFDRFEHSPGATDEEAVNSDIKQEAIEPQAKEPQPEQHEEKSPEKGPDVEVPIRTEYAYEPQLPPEELLPRHTPPTQSPYIEHNEEKKDERGYERAIRAARMPTILIAVFTALAALLGTGYFDTHIISNKPVGLIAGVALYNK